MLTLIAYILLLCSAVHLLSVALPILPSLYDLIDTADVAGSYILADMKDHVLIRLTDKTVELMCEVNVK